MAKPDVITVLASVAVRCIEYHARTRASIRGVVPELKARRCARIESTGLANFATIFYLKK